MSDLRSRVDNKMARSMRLSYWVVSSRILKDKSALMPYLEDHFKFILDLESRGMVFAGGPFLTDDGENTGSGMFILKAASREEVTAILEQDPFYVHRLRDYTIQRWQVNVGAISVSVCISQASVQLL